MWISCILFDWGDTLMRTFEVYDGPMAIWPRVELVAHADKVLDELHMEWKLALATNAADSNEKDIRAALHRVGLNQVLDEVYCFRRIGYRKPEPAFYKYILNDLELDQKQVIMVGDDFKNDVLGANRASIRAIWFNPCSEVTKSSQLYRTIHDLRELPQELKTFQFE